MVRDGYKQTEVGVIPNNWDYLPLGLFITELRGGAPLKPSDFTKSGVKVLPKGGVVRGGLLTIQNKDLQFCSTSYAEKYRKNQVDETYTIVVLRDLVPSGPSIGLIVRLGVSEVYVLAQGVYGFKLTEEVACEYLIQYSNSSPYRRLMNEIMVGSTQVHITNTAFKSAKLPFPKLEEQRSIAQALSDVDALIAALDKLIAKKRNLKTATMQQLLTGKKRLPGFGEGRGYKQTEVGVIPEDWVVDKIGGLTSITTGSRNTQDRVDDGKYPFFVRSQTIERINSYSFNGEAVLTAGDGVGTGKIFHYINGKFDIHQRVYKISHFKPELNGFFFYKYFSDHFYDRILSTGQKIANGYKERVS